MEQFEPMSEVEFAVVMEKAMGIMGRRQIKYISRKPKAGGGFTYKYKDESTGHEAEVHDDHDSDLKIDGKTLDDWKQEVEKQESNISYYGDLHEAAYSSHTEDARMDEKNYWGAVDKANKEKEKAELNVKILEHAVKNDERYKEANDELKDKLQELGFKYNDRFMAPHIFSEGGYDIRIGNIKRPMTATIVSPERKNWELSVSVSTDKGRLVDDKKVSGKTTRDVGRMVDDVVSFAKKYVGKIKKEKELGKSMDTLEKGQKGQVKYISKHPKAGGGYYYKYKHVDSGQNVYVKEEPTGTVHVEGKMKGEHRDIANEYGKRIGEQGWEDAKEIATESEAAADVLEFHENRQRSRVSDRTLEERIIESDTTGKPLQITQAEWNDKHKDYKLKSGNIYKLMVNVPGKGTQLWEVDVVKEGGKKKEKKGLEAGKSYVANKDYKALMDEGKAIDKHLDLIKEKYLASYDSDEKKALKRQEEYLLERRSKNMMEKTKVAPFVEMGKSHDMVGVEDVEMEDGRKARKHTYKHKDSGREIEVHHEVDGEAHVKGVKRGGHELAAKVAAKAAEEAREEAKKGGDDAEEHYERAKFFDKQAKIAQEHADVLEHHEGKKKDLETIAEAVKALGGDKEVVKKTEQEVENGDEKENGGEEKKEEKKSDKNNNGDKKDKKGKDDDKAKIKDDNDKTTDVDGEEVKKSFDVMSDDEFKTLMKRGGVEAVLKAAGMGMAEMMKAKGDVPMPKVAKPEKVVDEVKIGGKDKEEARREHEAEKELEA